MCMYPVGEGAKRVLAGFLGTLPSLPEDWDAVLDAYLLDWTHSLGFRCCFDVVLPLGVASAEKWRLIGRLC